MHVLVLSDLQAMHSPIKPYATAAADVLTDMCFYMALVQGLKDVYRGGQHEDKFARDIEVALTVKDEFGRVMTPKERFRQLCYE